MAAFLGMCIYSFIRQNADSLSPLPPSLSPSTSSSVCVELGMMQEIVQSIEEMDWL